MIGTFFKRVLGIGHSKPSSISIDQEAYGVKKESGISKNPIGRSESLFAIRRREHNRRIGSIAFESRRRNRG